MATDQKPVNLDLNEVSNLLTREKVLSDKKGDLEDGPYLDEDGSDGSERKNLREISEIEMNELDGKKTVFFLDFPGKVVDYRDRTGMDYKPHFTDTDFRPRTEIEYRTSNEYLGFEGSIKTGLGEIPDGFGSHETAYLEYETLDDEGTIEFSFNSKNYDDIEKALEEVLELGEKLSISYIEEKPVGRVDV